MPDATVLAPIVSRVHTAYCWRVRPGSYPSRIAEPLNEARIARHLAGPDRYGVTPIAPGSSTVRLALLDFDSHKGETTWANMRAIVTEVMEAARDHGLVAIPFKSSGGSGVHLYFLWDEPQDAYSVRMLLRAVLGSCNLQPGSKGGVAAGVVEVFPKQDEVPADGFGSMFVLPLAGKSVPLKGLE